MRQTSQAVALLLASVNAANVDVIGAVATAKGTQGATSVFSTEVTTPALASQLSNRTARYFNYKKATNQFSWDASTLKFQTGKVLEGAALNTAVSIAGSSCMKCLGGGAVWCSKSFNYWLAASKDYQYLTLTNADGMNAHDATTDAETWAGNYDQGSCCNSGEEFVKLAGYIGTQGTIVAGLTYAKGTTSGTSGYSGGVPNVARACVANTNTGVDNAGGNLTAFGVTIWDIVATKYTSWWCSNGMYKKVKSASTGVTNNIQLFSFNDNRRLELAMVGCPNKTDICGSSGYSALANTTPVVFGVDAKDLLQTDKCTWVVTSFKYAPTFVVTANTGGLGMTSPGWQLHTMEYTTTGDSTVFSAATGSLSSKFATSNTGFLLGTEGVAFGNFVPRFDMEAQQFATLRTWYGLSEGLMTQGSAQFGSQYTSWFTPGNSGGANAKADNTAVAAQGAQFYGNVATIGTSKYASTGTAALTASDGNYGLANSVKFDYRTVRYVPAAVVQSVYATGDALKTAYNKQVSDYNTAKTVWDNYVAILAKNAKMDAFAAAFSPPKAPTVPPLPNFPWAPAAYTGFLKQTTLQAALLNQNNGAVAFASAAQPASNQFWTSLDAAQSIGGWGSWTAQIMTYRSGWGKSFGTIGFSTDTKSSFVWNNNWMCIDSTQGDTLACANNKVTSAGTAAAPASTVGAVTVFNESGNAGSAQFVTTVSLWSLGDKNSDSSTNTAATWKSKSDVKITFTGETWSNTIPALTAAISYSAAPSAASSLTGIAGAQALAVSSAAVLALAALY